MSFFFSSKLKHPAPASTLGAPLPLDDDDNDGGIIIVEADTDVLEPLSQESPPALLHRSRQEHDDVQDLMEDDMTSLFYDLPQIHSAKAMDSVFGSASVHHPENDPHLNTTLSIASLQHNEDWDLSQSDLNTLEDDLLQIATIQKAPDDSSSRPTPGKFFLDDVSTHDEVDAGRPPLDVSHVIQTRQYEFETFQTIALGLRVEQSLKKSPNLSCRDDTESPLTQPLGYGIQNQATTKPDANHVWSVLTLIFAAALVFISTTNVVDVENKRFGGVAVAAIGSVVVVCLGRTVVPMVVWSLWNQTFLLLVHPMSIMGIALARTVERIVRCGWQCMYKTVQVGVHTIAAVATAILTVTSGVFFTARMLSTLVVRATIPLWLSYKFGTWMTNTDDDNIETVSFVDRMQRKSILIWSILLSDSTLPEKVTLISPSSAAESVDKVGTARETPIVQHALLSTAGSHGLVHDEPFSYHIVARLDNYKPEDVTISYQPVAELSFPCLASETFNNKSLILAGISQDYELGIRDDSILFHSTNVTDAVSDAVMLLIGITVLFCIVRLRRKRVLTSATAVSSKSEGFFRSLTGERLRAECRSRGLKGPVLRQDMIRHLCKHDDIDHSFPERNVLNYRHLSKDQLQRSLKELGQMTSGNKADLQYRLLTARESLYEELSEEELKSMVQQSQLKTKGLESARCLAEAGPWIRRKSTLSDAYFSSLAGSSHEAECRTCRLKSSDSNLDIVRRHSKRTGIEHSPTQSKSVNVTKSMPQRSSKDVSNLSDRKEMSRLPSSHEPVFKTSIQKEQKSTLRSNQLNANGVEPTLVVAEAGSLIPPATSEAYFCSLTAASLQAECRMRGVKVPVLRQDMIRRLCEHDKVEHSFPQRNLLKYTHLNKDQLQSLLKELGQMTSGNKEDLQYRLVTARENVYKGLTKEELTTILRQNQMTDNGMELARRLAEAGPQVPLQVGEPSST